MPLFWCQAEIHDVQFKNLKQPLHFFIFCQTLLFFCFFLSDHEQFFISLCDLLLKFSLDIRCFFTYFQSSACT